MEVDTVEYVLLSEMARREAKKRLIDFINYTMIDYDSQWFHEVICEYLDMLYSGEIKKLMIFVPPQHGKSEISSRRFPAYALGRNPKNKIAVCSYSPDLANGFNRSVQDVIESDLYQKVFPNTKLSSVLIAPEDRVNLTRNSSMFETVKHKGFLKTVGIGSPLTGTPVDIGIIDDPFKDRKTANSEIIRNDVWDWYNDVFKTRLHNDSKQLLLFTRWHEDDLAGRLLDPNNEHYDEEEAWSWTVVALPALKEKTDNEWNTIELNDPRKIDEALWEEKHSAKKFISRRRVVPQSFASLDQQRPSAKQGNKIKREWFIIKKESELPFNIDGQTFKFYIDGAFTEKTENDETALLACTEFRGILYILNCVGVRKELHELLPFFKQYFYQNMGSSTSTVNIELKASGYPLMSMLRTPEFGGFNAMGIPNKVVKLGKYNRVENAEPFLITGKVVLVQGSWNASFIEQCCGFPNAKHDDKVDVLCYAIDEHFITGAEGYETEEDLRDLDLHI